MKFDVQRELALERFMNTRVKKMKCRHKTHTKNDMKQHTYDSLHERKWSSARANVLLPQTVVSSWTRQ